MKGYSNRKKTNETFDRHTTCKTHSDARLKCDDFMNQRTNVARRIDVISKEEEKRYEIRLTSSLDVARFLIMQGDDFYGGHRYIATARPLGARVATPLQDLCIELHTHS